jgi:uncharacterized protein (DUF2147 family)
MSLLLLAAMLAATPSADTAVGTWRSPTKNAIIDVEKCGASLCGHLVSSDGIKADPGLKDVNNKDPKLQNRPLKGSLMLSGFRRDGNDWVDGSVYNGNDGRTYGGKITIIDANSIKLRGCVFVPLCKTETWTRVR